MTVNILRKAIARLAPNYKVLRKFRQTNMEVTKINFKEKLPEIEKAIDDSIFVAIDGEFTGLTDKSLSPFDTPEERFLNIDEGVKMFMMLQFGLCTFHYDVDRDCYTNRAYNFYLWPRPLNRSAPDIRFMCQTSCLDFLSGQNFDFNKLFKDGIPYLTPAETATLINAATEKRNKHSSSGASGNGRASMGRISIPEEYVSYVESTFRDIEKALNSGKDSFVVDKCNSFQRKLIYQTGRDQYPNIFLEPLTIGASTRGIRATRTANQEAEQRRRNELRDQKEMEEIDDAVGFSKVIQKLSKSKKLIVGHNMILDLCHTVNQFVEPLPSDYFRFKQLCSVAFPHLLDTKLMASTSPLKEVIKNSTLEVLQNTLKEEPFEMPTVEEAAPLSGYDLKSEKFHEAGYDAFVTGLCFIAMSNYLGRVSGDASVKHAKTGKPRVLPDSPLIAPFQNKLFMSRILDIPYMDLANDDIPPNRDHVFYVSFPPDWKASDLYQLFSDYGPINIHWNSDTSAFVSLQCKDNTNMAMVGLSSSSVYSVMPYKQYKSFQKAQATRSTPTPTAGQTGITPAMENSGFSFDNFLKVNKIQLPGGETTKKRSLSPEPDGYKRTKSVSDTPEKEADKKPFDVPSWD